MTVTPLTLILVAVVMSDASEMLNIYNSCYTSTVLTLPEMNTTPTSSQLPGWCLAMRHEVAGCVAEKMKIEDDGSVVSRGNVLLNALERTGDEKILIHVKLYHYGCVYNNWYNYVDDDTCYKSMLSQCVFGSSTCYYMPCQASKNSYKALAKQQREPTSGSARRRECLILGLLIMNSIIIV